MSHDGSNWVGTTLAGRYTVEEILGAGGMGTALRASDSNLQTDVVVKVPHRNMLKDEEFVKRFSQEVRSLVTLSHPHVVSVLDVGEHDGVPYAVMRYLPGGDLKDRCPRDAEGKRLPQDPKKLADWLDDVAKALDFIHAQGYVHRDIKPDNILFDNVQNAYVGDFGIIKAFGDGPEHSEAGSLTQEGVALGTPEYMAPEVVMGEDYDGRADQYALAATVYEMLCCQPPFRGKTPAAIIVKSTTEQAPDPTELVPSISRKVADCLLKGLSRNPDDRFPNCISFANEVLRLIRSEDRSTIRTHVGGTGESSDPERPTDQYKNSGKQPALATPPPLTMGGKEAECPGCGHRFAATTDTALTCPECRHSFPAGGDAQSAPPLPDRDTDRQPTNTLKQSPPPLPPQASKSSKSKKEKKKPAKGKGGKPAAEKQTSTNPDKQKAGTPFGAGKPTDKKKAKKKPAPISKPPEKVERSATIIEPLDDLEPPTVQPGTFAKPPKRDKRPFATAPTANPKPEPKPVEKPKPAKVASKPREREGGGGIFKLVAFLFTALLMVGGGIWFIIYIVGKSEEPADDPVKPTTIVVASDGSADYKTIAEAVAAADANTRIQVKPGSYSEPGLTLDKAVSIEGEDRDKVQVSVKQPILLQVDGATLKSMTIRITGDSKAGAIGPSANAKDISTSIHIPEINDARSLIRITNGKPTIRSCNLSIADGTAVVVDGSSANPTLIDCRIHGCGLVGVHFINQAAGTLDRCRFDGNRAAGVLVANGSPTLTGCKFEGKQHTGISVAKGSATLDDCDIEKTAKDAAISKSNTVRRKESTGTISIDVFPSAAVLAAPGTTLKIRNSRIDNSSDWGVRSDGKFTVEKTKITNSKSRGLQVDTNAEAVISETSVTGSKKRGVLVFGKATIDQKCDFAGGDLNVLYLHSSAKVKISDTTVRDGGSIGILCFCNTTLSNVTVKDIKSGTKSSSSGVYVRAGVNVTLTNCRITGGKSYGLRAEGNATLSGCTISQNVVDAIRVEDEGDVKIRGKSKLILNKGRGIYCEGKLTVDDCDIYGNRSSGIAVYGGTARLSNSRIRTTSAYAVYLKKQTVKTKSKTTRTEPSFVSIRNCTLKGGTAPTYKAVGCTLIIDGKIVK